MPVSNRWNRIVYRLWSPVYDIVLERLFRPGRRRSIELLAPQTSERLCLVGVGTGSDLPLLPGDTAAVGIDLSEAMLARARGKLPLPGREIELRVGDAQALPFDSGEFDAAILHLVLSVVPDPRRCLAETLRVLRPGGRIAVFDKFLPDNETPSPFRRLANLVSTLLGTNINRRLGELLAGQPCKVLHEEPSILGGMYRVVLLTRTD